MKDLGKTKFCLGLQLEHLPSGILVHQTAYIQKILEKFNMDKSYPSKTPMVVRSLDVEKDSLKPRDGVEGILGLIVPYHCAIGPTKTIGWELRISFDISKAPNILTYCINFGEI